MSSRSRNFHHHHIHLYILEAIMIVVLLIEGYKFVRFVMADNHTPPTQFEPRTGEP